MILGEQPMTDINDRAQAGMADIATMWLFFGVHRGQNKTDH
jgi:hypothetical protein